MKFRYQRQNTELSQWGCLVTLPIPFAPPKGEIHEHWEKQVNAQKETYNAWKKSWLPCSKEFYDVTPDGWEGSDEDFKTERGKQILFTDQQQWQEMSIEEKDEYFEKVVYPLKK